MHYRKHLRDLFRMLIVFAVMSNIVYAGGLPKQTVLPLKLASQSADAAMAQCRLDGYKVSVAVVDRSGVLMYQIRDDGAGVHTVDSSRRKAYTAASMRAPTQFFAELIGRVPEVQGLRDMNDSILILGGGLPVKLSGEVVGGIGVGGAPGGKLDEACARAGLKAINADLYEQLKEVSDN
ncbi:MAG TPA: heme-binding protein [Gammaproteobacteria bacterium]|nr:heme-binding protein [Gammaproteobacteria bacterium]